MTFRTNFKHELPSRFDEKRAKQLEKQKSEREAYAAVDKRDKRRCRAFGTRTDPYALGLTERGEHHHIRYRSRGGQHDPTTVVLLCAVHHHAIHQGRLRVDGDANECLSFWKWDSEDSGWYLWRREVAVGVFEKD